ncbi:MAG TPA: NAD(+) diphosphatase [Croceibacterium sp.]|nr:NAD(+) diphosphatase [Croceibacterium sp.]
MATTIAFAGSRLDRADHVRSDPERLAALSAKGARLLRLDGLMPLLDENGALQWDTLPETGGGAEMVFLGLVDGRAMFAAVPETGDTAPAYAIRDVWQLLNRMSPDDLAAYGGARSLIDWHARHRFCARCGGGTRIAKGGWQRDCTRCEAPHFPRVDPVAIMLVEHEDRLLLARQTHWPARRYSALAGFLEPGETIEEAVAREVLEESGIRVRDVRYVANQPWPFPSQLMIGCHAFADNTDLVIDTTELEEAHWFTREEITAAMAGDENGRLLTPPSVAIAYQLLKWWLEQ